MDPGIFPLLYGVLQRSLISPLLFLLYMSKLPKLLPDTLRSLFADDLMIHTEFSITRSDLQSNLQTSMDDPTLFNTDYRVILSSTKSVRVSLKGKRALNLNHKPVRSSLILLLSLLSLLTSVKIRNIGTLALHCLLKMNSSFQPMALPLSSTLTTPTSIHCLITAYQLPA